MEVRWANDLQSEKLGEGMVGHGEETAQSALRP